MLVECKVDVNARAPGSGFTALHGASVVDELGVLFSFSGLYSIVICSCFGPDLEFISQVLRLKSSWRSRASCCRATPRRESLRLSVKRRCTKLLGEATWRLSNCCLRHMVKTCRLSLGPMTLFCSCSRGSLSFGSFVCFS